jgi:uncharacterized protein DUF6152
MKTTWLALSVVTLVLGLGSSALAHHSAAQYDFSKSASITGVVMKFQAINPHVRLTLRVTDAKGTRDLALEGHSTNNFYRAGYRDGIIKYGDKVTANVAPMRDGSEGGYVVSVITASGVRFGAQSSAERAREQQKAEGK